MSDFNLNEFIQKLKKKNFWKNLMLFIFGMIILALAFNLFFDRYNIIPTGSSGLALLLSNYMAIDLSLIILIVGLSCMMLGLISFGYAYALKMLMITLIYPLFVSFTLHITNLIDLEDTSLLLLVVVGGGMLGFGNGLIRKSGYSPGGFCVLFDLMHKYLHISIGFATIIINTILIIFSAFTFGLDNAVYAIIGLLVSSYMVDRVIMGISSNKVFYIVTERPLEVKEYVMDNLHYDITLINARGGYTNKKRKMLMSVIPTLEYVKLKELVREIDRNAFFLIVDIYESSVRKKM